MKGKGAGGGPRPRRERQVLAVRMRIRGIVHGVFFRASMADAAVGCGVRGWVRNVADGSVEAYLEGEPRAVGKVVSWARRGPPRARVDSVDISDEEPKGFRGFRIIG